MVTTGPNEKTTITSLKRELSKQRRLLNDQKLRAAEERRHSDIMGILSHHIGKQNAIGMGDLYTRIFLKEWRHRINDTRDLRTDIDALRSQGRKICSMTDQNQGGYYLPATDSEWEHYKNLRIRHYAKGINKFRLIHKLSITEAMRQVQIILEGTE